MKNKYIKYLVISTILIITGSLSGCKQYDNFTTFFNTYYNAQRLMKESEDEFEYQEEKKRIKPRVFVPQSKYHLSSMPKTGTPPFMEEFIIEPQKLQPVKVKLDSIIIKGSKILARHPQSNYIEGSLFLMATAYFYRNEWLPSQVKCSELIDKFPDGDLSPDAHLLFVKNLLIQRKFFAGKIMLSRTIDIAWQKKRYDILSEAFRLEADLALYEGDIDGAVKPYRQAIAQSDDNEIRAKWQVDMASLLYRVNKFDAAAIQFRKVHDFSPDYMAEFEAYLYEAMCLIRLGKYKEADKILTKLERDGNNQEWLGYVFAARMSALRFQGTDKEIKDAESFSDSVYTNQPLIVSYYYEKGMDYFEKNDFTNARKYFARARNIKTPVFSTSDRMFFLLNSWEFKQSFISSYITKMNDGEPLSDTVKSAMAVTYFEISRIQEQLGFKDSAIYYCKKAIEFSPNSDLNSARYLYSYSRLIRDDSPLMADSLLEVLVMQYPGTEFGKEAIFRQGYTDKFVIDTVADLFNSGTKLRLSKEYNFANKQFLKVFTNYPENEYAPRSLYNIGWIYEKNLKIIDSALYYYQLLIDKYPKTDYAEDVKPSVEYLKAVRSGMPLDKDTIDPRKKLSEKKGKDKKKDEDNPEVNELNNNQKLDRENIQVNTEDIINDPMKFINNAKESLINPDIIKPDIDINVPNPLKLFSKPDKDTTNTKEKEVKPKK